MERADDLKALSILLSSDPLLYNQISLNKIIHFIILMSKLKNDIILTQPGDRSASEAAVILPPSIEAFLGEALDIQKEHLLKLWEVLKDTIWRLDTSEFLGDQQEMVYQAHGYQYGISKYCLDCTNHFLSMIYISFACIVSPRAPVPKPSVWSLWDSPHAQKSRAASVSTIYSW